MNDPEHFPKLDLIECEKIAYRWGKEYPFIEKISLYAGRRGVDYVLVARTKPNMIESLAPEERKQLLIKYTKFQKDWTQASRFCGFRNPILWEDRNSTLGYKEEQKSRPKSEIEFNDAAMNWELNVQPSNSAELWLYVIKEPGISKARTSQIDSYILDDFVRVLYDSTVEACEDIKKTGKHVPTNTVFPCKPGTQWEDITIVLVADDTVRVETPHGKGRFTYHELEMSDKRPGDKPKVVWALLKQFAKSSGVTHSENYKYDRKLPDVAKRLNSHLKKLFGIEESIYQAHYRKEKAYRTKIKFEDTTFK